MRLEYSVEVCDGLMPLLLEGKICSLEFVACLDFVSTIVVVCEGELFD